MSVMSKNYCNIWLKDNHESFFLRILLSIFSVMLCHRKQTGVLIMKKTHKHIT